VRQYVVHCHIKDVSPELAAAARGEETGIGSSMVPVGGGANAENIQRCLNHLNQTGWDGVVSIECHGSDANTNASVEWMKKAVKARRCQTRRA
jgi:sugar phosphate isomerase/epimerase